MKKIGLISVALLSVVLLSGCTLLDSILKTEKTLSCTAAQTTETSTNTITFDLVSKGNMLETGSYVFTLEYPAEYEAMMPQLEAALDAQMEAYNTHDGVTFDIATSATTVTMTMDIDYAAVAEDDEFELTEFQLEVGEREVPEGGFEAVKEEMEAMGYTCTIE